MNRQVEQLMEEDLSYLNCTVDSSREETPSGNGQSRYTALVSQQGLGTDHVVHAPHLHIDNSSSLISIYGKHFTHKLNFYFLP